MWLIIIFCIVIALIVGWIVIYKYLSKLKEYKYSLPLKSNAVGIAFNQFYDWYQLNPKRWVLLNDSVRIITKPSNAWYDKNNFEVCYFKSLKEWEKYKKFKEDLKTAETNERINKATIEILEAVQQDIDALRKQSNQEIKEASDRVVEIAERLKEQ